MLRHLRSPCHGGSLCLQSVRLGLNTWPLAPCIPHACPTVQCWEWEICNSKYKTYYSSYKCSCAMDQILNVIHKVNDEGKRTYTESCAGSPCVAHARSALEATSKTCVTH